MQTILQQFQHVDTNADAFDANFYPRLLARLQKAYTALLADYDSVWQAEAEGILEVTLRSRTQTLTVPVQGKVSPALALLLSEMLGDQLHDLQQRIILEHESLAREGESPDLVKLLTLLLTPIDEQGRAVRTLAPETQQAA